MFMVKETEHNYVNFFRGWVGIYNVYDPSLLEKKRMCPMPKSIRSYLEDDI